MSSKSVTSPPPESWVDVRDLRMRYLDWGGDGPPVLALHGLASSAHWYDLIAPLLRHRYRIIAPDQRGHGQTTQASSGYDWESLAADAVALLDRLGIEKAIVLGHSWGGNVAVSLAALHPGRVDAMVMIDGGFFTPRYRPNATWEEFRDRLSPRNVSGTREEFLRRMRGQLATSWNSDIERIVQTMVYEDNEGQIQDILRPANHAQVIKAMWDEPSSEAWPLVKCRTLIVPAGPSPERAGTQFAEMRKTMVEAAAQGIEHSTVQWIPETVHDIGFHKPNELATAILSFLDS